MTEAVPQAIDTEAARDFMQETLARITPAELDAVATDLEAKSGFFQKLLSPARLPTLSDDELKKVLGSIFATRRRAERIIGGAPELRDRLQTLLYGDGSVPERFQTFYDGLPQVDEALRCDLASECLHYVDPGRYWLWTRWMWDPKSETGSLPLVTMQEFDLRGASQGEIYEKVGTAVAVIDSIREAIDGYRQIGHGPFGTDVYLACVYGIYVYTTLRLRMTREFTKAIPELPELTRRLLGVYHPEVWADD